MTAAHSPSLLLMVLLASVLPAAERHPGFAKSVLAYQTITDTWKELAGLLVAGIFASAQSTLSSSMNSIATAYVTDFHRRAWPDRSDDNYLVVA